MTQTRPARPEHADAGPEHGRPGPKFYGKYRGTVVDNVDTMQRGRILAVLTDTSLTLPLTWAMPCVPAAGPLAGMVSVPAVGAGVWIEFEQGDPDYPIWVGCYWGSAAELPAATHLSPPGTTSFTLQTTLQNAIVVNDMPGPFGGIILKSATGASIIVNDTGIYLDNGKLGTVTLVGPMVSVNKTALIVK